MSYKIKMTLEEKVVSGTMFMLGLLEVPRAIFHGLMPYWAHENISGIVEDLQLEGKNLDIVATMTQQWGWCSFILVGAYWAPLIFEDAD